MNSQQNANNAVSNNNQVNNNQSANNQYAQPLKTNRSHSTIGIRERKKKGISTSSSITNLSSVTNNNTGNTVVATNTAPPIPEPDYSLSESENDEGEEETDDDGESEIAKELEKAAAREKLESTRETSGNSNTSGSSSSGSSSLPHSFSVEEIQKVRTQLKSSKSHPNDFLLQQTQQSLAEDGDNSSSGVSSDQDVPVGPPTGFDDTTARNLANETGQHPTTVLSVEKEANPKRTGYGGSGLLTRHAVSLAQLPPPIERMPRSRATICSCHRHQSSMRDRLPGTETNWYLRRRLNSVTTNNKRNSNSNNRNSNSNRIALRSSGRYRKLPTIK